MAEEEYKFDDLDLLASEPDATAPADPEPVEVPVEHQPFELTPGMRNGLIALGFLILVFIMYQFIAMLIPSKKSSTAMKITPIAESKAFVAPPKPAVVFNPPPVQAPVKEAAPSSAVTNQLVTIEREQHDISTSVNTLGNQLTTVSTDLADLTAQLKQMNGVLTTLNDKVTSQAQEIERLHQAQLKMKQRQAKHRQAAEQMAYALQAVIPGRAWLIDDNGFTLTVREGTSIPGYGVVQSIDAQQGRVMTSSGRVIRFSQADS
jgi:intracellular multiplication protein IcmG